MDFDRFQILTFDCYGTLVDWETGILGALRPLLLRHGVRVDDSQILEGYAKFEADAESGPYMLYADVLREVVRRFGARYGFEPTIRETSALVDSFAKEWRPFPDTRDALAGLAERYRLAVISNVDDDLFAITAASLGARFDWVVTAEQVGSYKPSRRNFTTAIERLGVPKESILHVAQSVYHDIVPAKELGLSTVWVSRPSGRPGFGAVPPAEATPDLEVPDLRTLASLACAGR